MGQSIEWSMRARAQEEGFPLRGAAGLVEPDETERKHIGAILRRMGLIVHETGSGAALGFIAAQVRLRVAVVNLMLRDAKALVLIRQLRRACPDLRIVAVMPAHADAASAGLELARVAGADAALQAPVAPTALARALTEPRRPAPQPFEFGDVSLQ